MRKFRTEENNSNSVYITKDIQQHAEKFTISMHAYHCTIEDVLEQGLPTSDDDDDAIVSLQNQWTNLELFIILLSPLFSLPPSSWKLLKVCNHLRRGKIQMSIQVILVDDILNSSEIRIDISDPVKDFFYDEWLQ